MTVWMNGRHHYDLFVTLRGGKRCLVVSRRIGSLAAEVACHSIGPGAVTLCVDADRSAYRFSGAAEPGRPEELAAGETKYLATEVAAGFTGVYLAMFCSGNGADAASPADFDWFEYRPQREE